MERQDYRAHLDKWINSQIYRIFKKFLEILQNEYKVELVGADDYIRYVILFNVLVKLIRAINFPLLDSKYLDIRQEVIDEYEEFAKSLDDRIIEICKELNSWRPKRLPDEMPDGVEESTVAQ